MNKCILLLLCALPLGTLWAQNTAKGIVYEDLNGNGKKDKKEKGIANVAVSNGVDIVLTNPKGEYQLSVGDDNVIFIIKPAGYKIALNENNLPQFYYLHKPKGAPELKYKGASPTGPLPASLDFALTSSPESDTFKALVFGDPQPYTLDEIKHFEKGVVQEVAGIKEVAFGLSLGDLVGDNLDLHQAYKEAIRK